MAPLVGWAVWIGDLALGGKSWRTKSIQKMRKIIDVAPDILRFHFRIIKIHYISQTKHQSVGKSIIFPQQVYLEGSCTTS